MDNVNHRPIRIDQPDGDTVYLPPWDYIMDQVGPPLERVNNALVRINAALTTINEILSGD